MATSIRHEGPLLLLGERPEMLAALLGLELPADARVVLASAEFTQAVPLERRADAVVTIEQDGVVTRAFVVEVQLAVDPDKAFSWPLYLASLHARVRCATTLVVLAPDRAVASWARRPIATFGGGEPAFRPLVLGPDEIPRITSPTDAERMPELAVLSALVHGDEPDARPVLEATVQALARLDDRVAESYLGLVNSSVGELARALLEALMNLKDYEIKGDLGKRYVAMRRQLREEGRLLGARSLLLGILKDRELGPSERVRALVETTTDAQLLERWVRAAATAPTEDAVFSENDPALTPGARRSR